MVGVGEGMEMLIWIGAIYLLLGVVTMVIIFFKEPIIFHAGPFLMAVFLIWPIFLWSVLKDNQTGRWI